MIRRSLPIHPLSWLMRLVGRRAPAVSPAGPQDAPQFAMLHAAAFQRGWSAEEFERLLIEPNVVADRAMAGSRLAGFVLSRLAAEQAEILSIAVAVRDRRRGLASSLLDVHLNRLAGYGTRSLFLEVDERNIADLELKQSGELMLSGLPGQAIPFTVHLITPVSTAKEGRNFFQVEAQLTTPSDRLRPGMEGVGKIVVGERRLIWIWTHGLIDWLRIWAWKMLP